MIRPFHACVNFFRGKISPFWPRLMRPLPRAHADVLIAQLAARLGWDSASYEAECQIRASFLEDDSKPMFIIGWSIGEEFSIG
jgi:hypothetical protein